MNKTLKIIGSLLTLLVLLPIIIVVTLQITNLSEDEERISNIYQNQLQSILFSLNQYSEDFVSSWKNQIKIMNINFDGEIENNEQQLNKLLSENNALIGIFLTGDADSDNHQYYTINNSIDKNIIVENIKSEISLNTLKIEKLKRFDKSGYDKIEPLGELSDPKFSLLLTILNEKVICIMVVDAKQFIIDNLSQKIQQATQENFVIAAGKNESRTTIYSTDKFDFENENLSLALWLFPDYNISIQLKGQTIKGLAKNRLFDNFFILIILSLVLIFGLWFVFRLIKKEVRLAQIKSDFVSNVSHELRTPLALITMYAETLEMGRVNSDEKRKEYYSIISNETNRLSKIVNSILSFSKIEAGKRKYNFEFIDLNVIVNNSILTFETQLMNEGFKYNFDSFSKLPEIKVDKEAVAEAVINLIDNAIKYSNEKKEIQVRTGTDKNFVFVEVIDNGVGISAEDQTKIFDKFFRVTTGDVHDIKGTGLGLSLVKHIMDAHKGDIQIQSKIGKGSTFRLNFRV
ncbi:MAG: GHKL domain-containing protein [Ignavibacteriae bacterium]|nr:GHKL domain-containing protein [Ignavibacteriota bacterium]NOH00134.1 GHKL domain-containing protein [Ignavibacteriota bacterium]